MSYEKEIDENSILFKLREEQEMKLKGGLYHQTQIRMAYNSNHMEGSRLTEDQTRSIYETRTIGVNDGYEKIDDIIETVNHFRCFDYILSIADKELSEDIIKHIQLVLKSGTLDSEKEWFNIGEYKKMKNVVGNITTTLPKDVKKDMKDLLAWYETLSEKKIEDIIEFHVRFERIHPFQDGNGRVGRMIMFRECLYNDIMPFFIEEKNKDFYIRGIKEYQINNIPVRICISSIHFRLQFVNS